LRPLQRQFETLHRTLANKGGITEEDHSAIERLRQRYAQFNAEHPDHRSGIAGELQLASWLQDHDRVHELFETLVLLDPEDISIGFAWAGYFSRLRDQARVDQIYIQLLRINPDNREIRLTLARRFKSLNQFPRAIETLSELELNPTEDLEAILLLSDCLFAENRFEEALDTLKLIPSDVLNRHDRIRRQVEQVMPARESYVQYWEEELQRRDADAAADDLPRAEIITPRGRIVVELFENEAPNTVANFITLAESDFYDETTFHRVIAGFMSQGGDPNTKPGASGTPGAGGPGYVIADEIHEDSRMHFAGTLSMANSGPNTNGSQFFLNHVPTDHLNGLHTVFGRILEGLDVARSLEANDVIETINVLRKRDHAYEVVHHTAPPQPTQPDPSDVRIPDDIPEDLQQQLREMLEQEGITPQN